MTRPTPVNEEVFFDGRSLISETDLQGNITYVNRKFVEMSAYSKKEAIGQPHNILRHPDMPKIAFKQMWDVIQEGRIWDGIVKNLRKDGKFYWVEVHVVPKKNDAGEVVGYIASRKIPEKNKLALVKKQYEKLLAEE